jgi:hypothetical protein
MAAYYDFGIGWRLYWNSFHLELMLIVSYYITIETPKQEKHLVRREKVPVTLKKEAEIGQNDACMASFPIY